MDTNKKFWDKSAKIYDFAIKKDKNAYKKVIERIRSILKKDMNVLEIATGTGLIAVSIASFCKTIEATDFSEEMIKTAKQKHSAHNLVFSVANATNLPYPDCSYDVVVISNALHIMPNPASALNNIKRVLKDDGFLIAPTFMRNSHITGIIREFIMKIAGFKTFSKWDYRQYLQFIIDNDWEIKEKDCFKASYPLAFVIAKKNKR